MATLPFDRSNNTTTGDHLVSDYTHPDTGAPRSTQRGVGALVFVWLGWALLAAFWGVGLTAFSGILTAIGNNPGTAMGGADVGGVGWFMMTVVGVFILGVALAYGVARYHTRDRRLDAVTETATAALYDQVQAQGGEDLTTRSPEARRPQDRDLYRASRTDLP
jgi:hypothetical protein